MIAASPLLASSAAAKPPKSKYAGWKLRDAIKQADANIKQPAPAGYTYKLADGTVVPMSGSQKNIVTGHWRQFTSTELYQYESPIVVTLVCERGYDRVCQGTGVIINENTIITDWHVVRCATKITAYDYLGTKYENGRLGIFNKSVDVAAVSFDSMHSKRCATFVTDSNWEVPGEAVYAIGAPEGFAQTFTNGMFSGWLGNGALFRFTAPTGHGGSGGPIFNAYGLVIGLVRGGIGESGGGLNFAISTNAILEALQLTNADHPKPFITGVTNGVELRSKDEIALDQPSPVLPPAPQQPKDDPDIQMIKPDDAPPTAPPAAAPAGAVSPSIAVLEQKPPVWPELTLSVPTAGKS
jgi:S1-C subfamily serine protease